MASGCKPFLLQLLQWGIGCKDWGAIVSSTQAVGAVLGRVNTCAVLQSLLVDLHVFFTCFMTYNQTDWLSSEARHC